MLYFVVELMLVVVFGLVSLFFAFSFVRILVMRFVIILSCVINVLVIIFVLVLLFDVLDMCVFFKVFVCIVFVVIVVKFDVNIVVIFFLERLGVFCDFFLVLLF